MTPILPRSSPPDTVGIRRKSLRMEGVRDNTVILIDPTLTVVGCVIIWRKTAFQSHWKMRPFLFGCTVNHELEKK